MTDFEEALDNILNRSGESQDFVFHKAGKNKRNARQYRDI
jgi:hypothetical protein